MAASICRLIERVNRGADELARDVAWKLRVRVECDHVTDRLQQCVVRSAHDEARVLRAAKQPVKLFELAAFALPAHPFVLALVPLSFSVKEVKALVAVAAVQRIDAALRDREET